MKPVDLPAMGPYSVLTLALYQEDTGIPLHPYEPHTSLQMKASLLINLPAVFIGGIVSAMFAPANDSAALAFAIPLAFPIWFAIGSWIDHRGWRRQLTSKRKRLSRITRSLLGAIAALLCFVGLSGLTTPHHKTAENNFISSVLLLWTVPYLFFMVRNIRRQKAESARPR